MIKSAKMSIHEGKISLSHRLKTMTLLLCASLCLTGCTGRYQRSYENAESLLEQEKYEEAAAKLQELGSYEEAGRLLMYCRAAMAAENGDYVSAQRAFSALGTFRDAEEMSRYYEAREAEASGKSALESGDSDTAIDALKSAAATYAAIDAFRDAAQRATDCQAMLYERGIALLDGGQYASAQAIFEALGNNSDSAQLKEYCEASLLEAEGAYLDAAEVFSGISGTRDASERADSAREHVYQQALAVSAGGDQESAISLFAALGSYRDAEEQCRNMVRLLVRERLQHGDYEGALFQMDLTPDAIALEPVSDGDRSRFASFLDGFVEAYLHFSAGSMDSYSGYFGVAPYIQQGSALDWRFRQVLMIGSYSHNSNFIYYGSELLDLFRVDGDCYLAYIRASASVNQPIGPVEVSRTFRIMVRDSESGLVAGSIEDCLYGQENPTGRPVVSGPLPNGALPADEDGDGIILVDVKKKGFNGTMIIVLDPSRVFAGGPGFYGGNGMLLEDLVGRYDALGGINGGGFIDEDGGGSGGLPEGLTIVDGQAYHWAGSGASAAFDEDNILHVGYYTIESAAEEHIRDCVSFGPALIVDGIPDYGSYMESGINPRTAIGQREDGAVLLLCIDGRQIHSIGASFADIRDVMLDFGAINACSLDGGSSTVMYFNGEYLNSPSSASGTSRYLPNAFLIRK